MDNETQADNQKARFIKFIPSEEALHLALRHPNAFMLLMFIAERARRRNGGPDGLKIGQCHIGDHKNYGLTERKYRTAKDILVSRKHLTIVETCRTRQKSTTGTTTRGTLVQLLDTRVWDINPETNDDRNDDRPTTDRRPTDDEQERRRSISNDIHEEEARREKRPRLKDSLRFDFESQKFEGILPQDLSDWEIAFPNIDLKVEIVKATQWLKSNPSKSHKKNWRKYLTGWFGRTNDALENKKAYRSAINGHAGDRRTKDLEGNPVDNQYKGRF